MTDRITAPFTEQQVAALNACQRSGVMHPFTCGNEHPMHQTLIAETDGWHCPDETCDYRQNWAHAFMADPTMLGRLQASLPGFLAVQRAEDPMAAELKRTREQLRATEFDLGQERQQNVVLAERLAAEERVSEALRIELRMLEAARRIPAQPPDPDGGLCDPALMPARSVRDAGSIDTWQQSR